MPKPQWMLDETLRQKVMDEDFRERPGDGSRTDLLLLITFGIWITMLAVIAKMLGVF